MGFTSEEIQAAVDKYLITAVATTKTPTGARDTLAMRDEVYDLLTTALLMRPDSYFYLVWLSTNKLNSFVKRQYQDVQAINSLIGGLGRRTQLIEDTTELTNAQAALLELNAGLNSRRSSQGISSSIGPAVVRFQRSIDRFAASQLRPNVVASGAIVETPQEIRERVRVRWAEAGPRHSTITTRAAAVQEAVSRLTSIQLPEKSVRDIVGRISSGLLAAKTVMESSDNLGQARETLLDLLAQRSILTQASQFRIPTLVRTLERSDSATMSITSPDVAPALVGDVSGPALYEEGSTLDIALPAAQTLQLPSTAEAILDGGTVTVGFPYTPTTEILRVSLNGGSPTAVALAGGPYADLPALASYLNGLVAGLQVIASGDSLYYSSAAVDGASVHLLATSTDEILFISQFAPSNAYALGTPVPVDTIAEHISDEYGPEVIAEEVRTELGTYPLAVIPGLGFAVLDYVGVSISLSAGSPTAVATVDLQALGVVAGQILLIPRKDLAGDTFGNILSVVGNTLTLDVNADRTYSTRYGVTTVSAAALENTLAQVQAEDSQVSGLYRCLSSFGSLLQTTTPPPVFTFAQGDFYTSYLKLSAPGSSSLEVTGGTALSSFFSAPAGPITATGRTGTVALGNLPARGVRVGDTLRIAGEADQLLTSVSKTAVTFSPGIELPGVAMPFTLISTKYLNWQTLAGQLLVWLATNSSLRSVDEIISRVIRGNSVTVGQQATLAAYEAALSTLSDYLDAYVVPEERVIKNALNMLAEQGMNRALDLLVALELSTFFTMPKDAVSYSTNLVRAVADAGRELLPMSKRLGARGNPFDSVDIVSTQAVEPGTSNVPDADNRG